MNQEEVFYVFFEYGGRVFCYCVFYFVCVHHWWTNWDLRQVFLIARQQLANELYNCLYVFWLMVSFVAWCSLNI
jgi:hypothetical protein